MQAQPQRNYRMFELTSRTHGDDLTVVQMWAASPADVARTQVSATRLELQQDTCGRRRRAFGPMRRRRLSKLGGGGLRVAKCSSANRTQRLASCGAS